MNSPSIAALPSRPVRTCQRESRKKPGPAPNGSEKALSYSKPTWLLIAASFALNVINRHLKGRHMNGTPPAGDLTPFRAALGIVALVGGLAGMAGLYFIPIPAGNREPLLLALGLVLGWGSTVIGYEFGSSPAGRKAAEAGLRPCDPIPK